MSTSSLKTISNNYFQSIFSEISERITVSNILKQSSQKTVVNNHSWQSSLTSIFWKTFWTTVSATFLRTISNNSSNNHCQEISERITVNNILNESSQKTVVSNHSKRLLWDVIFRDWFWTTLVNNISQNHLQQLSRTLLSTIS